MSKPNIIYILSDEHRGQAMSHMGDRNLKTPAMDALAEGGVSFGRAYANCPICTPSRGTIFSGRHAHSGPVANFFDGYKISAPSTATELRKYGYHTAYFGKWHCGITHDQYPPQVRASRNEYIGVPVRTPEFRRAGFEDWFGFESINAHFQSYYFHQRDANPTRLEGYETDCLTDLALDYIKEYNRDRPLFMVLSVTPPHFPLEAPDEWKRFDPEALEVRPNFTNTPAMRERLATYYAMIENLDWNIGRLTDAVRGLPGFEDTMIIYISDHGDFMGSHNWHSRKELPQEESVRIPALFNWPGRIPERGIIGGLFSLVDLLPTTLGLIDAEIPEYCQGTDFSPALFGDQKFSGPETVLLEMVGNPRWNVDFIDWRTIMTDRWKFSFYETGAEELFDLHNDPYELDNLIDKNPEKREELKQRLLELLAETREPFFDIMIRHGVPCTEEVLDVSGREPR